MNSLAILISIIGTLVVVQAQHSPCSPVDEGEWLTVKPVLYLDIYEATEQDLMLYPGDSMYQSELRLHGIIDNLSPNGMILEPQGDFIIVNPDEVFKFETESGHNIVRLVQPLDRDGPSESVDDDVEVITFTLKCSPASNRSVEVFYDVSIRILDKNDNPPVFVGTPYSASINELISIGTSVLTVSAIDKDSNLDGNITYSIIKKPGVVNDGSHLFEISTLDGSISVKGKLDYESLADGHKYYNIRVVVEDGGPEPRLSSYTDIKIEVEDGNDHGPSFMYPGCIQHEMLCVWPEFTTDTKAVVLNKELILHAVPNSHGDAVKMIAKDMDAVPSDIVFSLAATIPTGYGSYFSVETVKSGEYFQAVVKQKKDIELPTAFALFIKAEEISQEKRFEVGQILYQGQTSNSNNNPSTTTTRTTPKQVQPTNAPNVDEKSTSDDTSDKFSQTTVALIVVIAVTLTLVLCLTIAIACIFRRKRDYLDKVPLTSINGGHDNKTYSAQL